MCEHVFVSIRGSSHTWFRRAIESDHAHVAWVAALELGWLARLEDSVALVLCISRDDQLRYSRACNRLLIRLQQSADLPLERRERIRSALAALSHDERSRAAALEELEQAFIDHELAACAHAVVDYRGRQPPATADA